MIPSAATLAREGMLRDIPPRATAFTDKLKGATLDELLDAAERDCWPNNECHTEWLLLRNWAIQTETLMLDEAEDQAWEHQMRALARRELPYVEWVAARLDAIADRLRARKLAQTNLRYKYGFKPGRRRGLVTRAVRSFFASWTSEVEDL